MHGQQNIKIC